MKLSFNLISSVLLGVLNPLLCQASSMNDLGVLPEQPKQSFVQTSGPINSGGGDTWEADFQLYRQSLIKWLKGRGPETLELPDDTNIDNYRVQMLQILEDDSIIVFFTNDVLTVGGVEKTCVWSIEYLQKRIGCNIGRYSSLDTASKFGLVHHEYAGLVGIEKKDGAQSNYFVSNQILAFVVESDIPQLAETMTTRYPNLVVAPLSFHPNGNIWNGIVGSGSTFVHRGFRIPVRAGSRISFHENGEVSRAKLEEEFDMWLYGQKVHVLKNPSSETPIDMTFTESGLVGLKEISAGILFAGKRYLVKGYQELEEEKYSLKLVGDSHQVDFWGQTLDVSSFSFNKNQQVFYVRSSNPYIVTQIQGKRLPVRKSKFQRDLSAYTSQSGHLMWSNGEFNPITLDLHGNDVLFKSKNNSTPPKLELTEDQIIKQGHFKGLAKVEYSQGQITCGSNARFTDIEFTESRQLLGCTYFDDEAPIATVLVNGQSVVLRSGKVGFYEDGGVSSFFSAEPFVVDIRGTSVTVSPALGRNGAEGVNVNVAKNGELTYFATLNPVTLFKKDGSPKHFEAGHIIKLDSEGFVE